MPSNINIDVIENFFNNEFSSYIKSKYDFVIVSDDTQGLIKPMANNYFTLFAWQIVSEENNRKHSSYLESFGSSTNSTFIQTLGITVQLDLYTLARTVAPDSTTTTQTNRLSRIMKQQFNYFYFNYFFKFPFTNLGYTQDWFRMPKKIENIHFFDRWTCRMKFQIDDMLDNQDPLTQIGKLDFTNSN